MTCFLFNIMTRFNSVIILPMILPREKSCSFIYILDEGIEINILRRECYCLQYAPKQ